MRQAKLEIAQKYGEQFTVFHFSLEDIRGIDDDPYQKRPGNLLPRSLRQIFKMDLPHRPELKTWVEFRQLFHKADGLWDKPLLLLIDEVDTCHLLC